MPPVSVAVTGFGIISPFGRGADENVSGLREGRSGLVSQRPEWVEKKLRSHVSGRIDIESLRPLFDRKMSRFLCDPALLCAAAMKDAIDHAGLSTEEVENPRSGIALGTGGGSSMMDVLSFGQKVDRRGGAKAGAYHVPLIMGSSSTANIGSIFRIRGYSCTMTSACATSAHTIMQGLDLIRSGRQDRVFAGGSEDINVYCAAAFDGMNALSSAFNDTPARASRPLDRGRDGFVFSGGAGVVVLENLEVARARGAKILAIVEGAAATCDGDDMVSPNGIGAESAMNLAMADAGVAKDEIDYINLHGTSTPVGDLVELEAILRVFGKNVPAFSSTKSMTGHGLGAAGVQEAIFSVLMMQERFLAPNINLEDPEPLVGDLPVVRSTTEGTPTLALSNSFGFGGTNCSLVLSHPERSSL